MAFKEDYAKIIKFLAIEKKIRKIPKNPKYYRFNGNTLTAKSYKDCYLAKEKRRECLHDKVFIKADVFVPIEMIFICFYSL